MNLLSLIGGSLMNRKFTAILTILAIALSVMLLVGVEKVRDGARASFANTISGTDLIVGGRSGSLALLLYSVFRIGNATNNITWESYQDIANRKGVKWTVPISLGDSHRGFRVMGTDTAYFEHFRFARVRALSFATGQPFADVQDVVLGAEVATALKYKLGDQLVLAHGLGDVNLIKHDENPFTVVGILEKTGTPVDRTLHVSLEGIAAIHIGWESGMPPPDGQPLLSMQNPDLQPEAITAFLIGTETKFTIFGLQRIINEYPEEPLLAILPGVALQELWDIMSVAEKALFVISVCVVLTGLIGMMTAILTSLNERRREMAILRSVGARPRHILLLLVGEAVLLALIGVLLGIVLLYAVLWIAQPEIESRFGLFIPISGLSGYETTLLLCVLGAALLMGLVPAVRAYLNSLADGLSIRT